jgi:hypothetical protein
MKKLIVSVIALFGIFNAKAQENTNNEQPKKLTFDEANLVSSYYKQNGNNSAVTGGIGTEKLTDISNTIDVTMVKYDKKDRKNKFDFSVGIDHYTSAYDRSESQFIRFPRRQQNLSCIKLEP